MKIRYSLIACVALMMPLMAAADSQLGELCYDAMYSVQESPDAGRVLVENPGIPWSKTPEEAERLALEKCRQDYPNGICKSYPHTVVECCELTNTCPR